MTVFVTFRIQCIFHLFISTQISLETLAANINIVPTKIWIISAAQTYVPSLPITVGTSSTSIASESMRLHFTDILFCWLNVISKSFQSYLFAWAPKQHAVVAICIVKTFFLACLFNTFSASKIVWILVPSAPVKWKHKLSFTVSARSIVCLRNIRIFDQVLFKLNQIWVDLFENLFEFLNQVRIVLICRNFDFQWIFLNFAIVYFCFNSSNRLKNFSFTKFLLKYLF